MKRQKESNRRDFIKKASLITAGAMFIPMGSCSVSSKNNGLFLNTLKENLLKDFKGTLKVISDIGYKYIEADGYVYGKFYGFSPGEFNQMIKNFGMMPVSSHTLMTTGNYQMVLEDAAEAGFRYVIQPALLSMYRKSIDAYKEAADYLNKFGEFARDLGMKIGYHNYNYEFEKINGKVPYDVLIKETDEQLVTMELDLYWMIRSGVDPIEYFNKYPGRFELWQLQDMDDSENRAFAEVGEGTIDFESIFTKKKKAGLKYHFVEQDICRGKSPLECIRISYNNLTLKNF